MAFSCTFFFVDKLQKKLQCLIPTEMKDEAPIFIPRLSNTGFEKKDINRV